MGRRKMNCLSGSRREKSSADNSSFRKTTSAAIIRSLLRGALKCMGLTNRARNITFNRNFRVMIENKFNELQNRVLQNISSTAEERYLAFLEQYPSLSNRLPGTQIASYLGVTPEFLSKIRKDITSK